MRKIRLTGFVIIISVLTAWAQNERSPNIIFIFADDLGWSCLSSQMDKTLDQSASDYHETPNIDRLAQQGMRFSRGYASAAICTPSRRSILFGQTPMRQGDETFSESYKRNLKTVISIPRALKSINPRYRTAHYGKWDLRASIFPEEVGYDESDGNTGNRHGDVMMDKDEKWTSHFLNNDPKRTVTLTERSLNFMERQVRSNNPFYLQISHYATHVDMQARQETYKKYQDKTKGIKHNEPGWAAMLDDLDECVGRILDRVEELGISDNTYIIFSSDNGAVEFLPPVRNRLDHPSAFEQPMRNYPLRGGKWTLYEGGIRVPLIVSGPDVKANSQCDVPVAGWDILPTFCDIAGSELTETSGLDGGSFAPLLRNAGKGEITRPTSDLYFHRYQNGYPHSAVIRGNFKLIRFWKSGKTELYALDKDPGELKDIASGNPQKVKELSAALSAYMSDVNPDLSSIYK